MALEAEARLHCLRRGSLEKILQEKKQNEEELCHVGYISQPQERARMASDEWIASAYGLSHFARTIYRIYEYSERDDSAQTRAFLDLTVRTADRALKHTPEEDQHYAARLSDLADYLNIYCNRYGGADDMRERLIQLCSDSARKTSQGDPDLAARFSKLSHVLEEQYLLRKQARFLMEAIEAAVKAEEATPPEDVHKAARLDDLARLSERQCDSSRADQDKILYLENAIYYAELALRATEEAQKAKDDMVNEKVAPDQAGTPEGEDGTDEGVEIEEVPKTEPEDKQSYAARLGYLSSLLTRLWAYASGDNGLLNNAIRYAERAEKETEEKNPCKPMRMRNLSIRLLKRFELAPETKGQDSDIERALSFAKDAAALTPQESAKWPSRLNNLARIHQSRYLYFGEEEDLIAGIACAERAAKAYEAMEDPTLAQELARSYNSLSTLYLLQFMRTSGSNDIEVAVRYAHAAMNCLKFDDPDAGGLRSRLAIMLETKFKRFADEKDLKDAVDYAQSAIELTGESNKTLQAGRRSDLASIMETKFRHTKNRRDINDALLHAQTAVEWTERDDPNRLRRIDVLVSAIVTRSNNCGGNLHSLSLFQTDVIAEMKARAYNTYGPNRGNILFNLGRILELQLDLTGARIAYGKVAECEIAAPLIRVRAWRRAGILYADEDKWAAAFDMFQKAVSFLPRVSFYWLNLDDHEHILGQLTGLSSLVAVAALKAGKGDLEALVWAEKGRGAIANLVTNARLNPYGLENKAPANHFERLRCVANSVPVPGDVLPQVPSRISEKASRWLMAGANRGLQEAEREIEELTPDITKRLSPSRLRKLARHGSIVSFNTTRYGCGAFLVTRERPVRFKPLEHLDERKIEKYAKILRSMNMTDISHRFNVNQQLRDILRWLWETAVGPVLDELNMKGVTGAPEAERLPRIWWVVGGSLGSFPLHAAGICHKLESKDKPGSKENTLSRAVSTYVPTIRSLQYSRTRARHWLLGSSDHVLAITAPEIHGWGRLEVKKEIDAIKAAFLDLPGGRNVQQKDYPSPDEARDSMRDATIVHFSCHGDYRPDQPFKSGLLLKNRAKGEPERLTAGELMGMRTRSWLDKPGLSYLSACSMAKNGSRALMDEAIHPANALFRAGFPNVVAHLWEVKDRLAPVMVRNFYGELAQFIRGHIGGEKGREWDRAVADALHNATLLMLKKGNSRKQPADWANLVHIGC
ncbi:hypothetical protein DL765_009809 [Monosporascus sp. GIB2]|nr:hypothetical protein DL765_009809 [Monosporascus sp. GIB2]